MASEALLGIDIGASGCKVVLYDFNGYPLLSMKKEYPMSHPKPGWVEEDPEEWWEKIAFCLRHIIDNKSKSIKIAGIAISCTNALVAVDRSGKSLRPAIMQLDQRTIGEIELLNQKVGSGIFFKIAKNRLAKNYFSAPVILWIKENEPSIYKRTYRFLAPSGFIVHHLTGNFSIDYSRASTTLLLDSTKKNWSDDLIHVIGVSRNKLPDLYESWEIVGCVTETASTLTGLPTGIPVVAGCVDTLSATIGMGVVNSNETGITMGTVARLSTVLDEPPIDDRFINCIHVLSNHWLAMAPISGAGSSLRWFRDVLNYSGEDKRNKNDTFTFTKLINQASKSSPGANGLLYVPYISGECSPHWDPNARALFFGLGLYHNKGDMVRSILEGIAFSIRENLEIIEKMNGSPIIEMRIGGGGSQSALWNQIFADILGRKIIGLHVRDTETLGAALIAGVGLHIYPNLDEACAKSVIPKDEWSTHISTKDFYDKLYSSFCQLYSDLRGSFNNLREVNRFFTQQNIISKENV